MSRYFPPPDPLEEEASSTIRLPKKLWNQLDEIAERETSKLKDQNPKAKIVSRTDAMRRLLDVAVTDYWKGERKLELEAPEKKKK